MKTNENASCVKFRNVLSVKGRRCGIYVIIYEMTRKWHYFGQAPAQARSDISIYLPAFTRVSVSMDGILLSMPCPLLPTSHKTLKRHSVPTPCKASIARCVARCPHTNLLRLNYVESDTRMRPPAKKRKSGIQCSSPISSGTQFAKSGVEKTKKVCYNSLIYPASQNRQ